MNRIIKNVLAMTVLAGSCPAMAQEDVKPAKKETEEIIIRKKVDKDVNVTIQIKGDEILVNGKPLAEFKGDDVIVSKRKMRIMGNDRSFEWEGPTGGMNFDRLMDGGDFQFWNDDKGGKEEKFTFLGVTTEENEAGARITGVNKESSAEKAGLKVGDIITKVGNNNIEGPEDLSNAIKAMKPKDEATITYKRDGKVSTTKATLGEKVERNVRVFSMSSPRGSQNRGQNNLDFPNGRITIPRVPNFDMKGNFEDFGNRVDALTFALGRPKLGLKIQDVEEGEGVKVINVEAETAAAKAGLKKDDVIIEINGKKVSNTDDAREQLQPSEDKKSYSIKAKRNGTEMSFDVKVPKKIKTATF